MFVCRRHIRSFRLVTLGGVLVACGETARSSDNDGTGGVGGTSVDVGDSGEFGTTAVSGGGGSSTTAAYGVTTAVTTAGYGGATGVTTASYGGSGGFSTTASLGGSGGSPSCGAAEARLEGCYTIAANVAGAGGEAGASGWEPECWRDFADDCESSFEGEVLEVGAGIDARWCDIDVFGGLTHAEVNERQWLVIADENATMRVVLGRPAGELDVAIGDTVEATMTFQNYHDGFMWGRRLTLTRNGELLALLNDNLPIDERTHLGDLTLQRGAELCQRPADAFTCTYVAHDLDVQIDDEGISVSPNSSARLGPYEILTDANFDVRDGGGCDSGDTSDFLIARVKP